MRFKLKEPTFELINSSIKLKTNEFARPKLKRKQNGPVTKSKMNKHEKSDDENVSDNTDNDEDNDNDESYESDNGNEDDCDNEQYPYEDTNNAYDPTDEKKHAIFATFNTTNRQSQQPQQHPHFTNTASYSVDHTLPSKMHNAESNSSPLSVYYNSSGLATPVYKSSSSSVYNGSNSSSSNNSDQFLTLPTVNISSMVTSQNSANNANNNESPQLYAWMKDGRHAQNTLPYMQTQSNVANMGSSRDSPHKLTQNTATSHGFLVETSAGTSPNMSSSVLSANQNDSDVSITATTASANSKTSLCAFVC